MSEWMDTLFSFLLVVEKVNKCEEGRGDVGWFEVYMDDRYR